MKNKFLKFLLLVLLGAFIGMMFGFFSAINVLNYNQIYHFIIDIINEYSIYMYVVVYVMIFISFYYYVNTKKLDINNDDNIKKIDLALENSMGLSAISMVICFIIFAISVINIERAIISTVLFIVYIILLTYIQYLTIEMTKKINPEKKVDCFDTKFNSKWYELCDELERQQIGNASYKAYKNSSIIVLVCYLVTFILVFNHIIDSYVLIIIGIIWLTLVGSYLFEARKYH